MQRRQFLKSTSVALAATLSGCGGGESGVAAQSGTPTSPAPAPAPPPTPAPGPAAAPLPAGRFLDVPSQLNEQQMYDNVLGWSWTASDKTPTWGANPGPIGGVNLTDDTEGDDLWSHYQAYKRTGNPIHLQWAQRWRDWFVNGNFYNQWANQGDGVEHTFGWGLALWGVERSDSAALAALEQIAARIEQMYTGIGPGYQMSFYGNRMRARHLLVACYQAQVNPIARWTNLRDLIVLRWLQSPDWEDTKNSPIIVGGSYFLSDNPYGNYATGQRVQSAFSYGILCEAFWRVYQQTGRTDVRDRLIAMARFINYYCVNPANVNGMSGSWWGHSAGRYHHPNTNNANTNPNVAPSDPTYQTAIVNALVIGYKLTGEAAFLNKAKEQFRKGTQYVDYGGAGAPKQPDNLVHHYIDTLDNSGGYFAYNKGELQYSYLLFENGGAPSVEAR